MRYWALHFRQLQITYDNPNDHNSALIDDGFSQEQLQASLGNDIVIGTSLEGSGENAQVTSTEDPLEEMKNLLYFHLLIILRMSINCPFDNVRRRFSDLIAELRVRISLRIQYF